MDTTLIIIVAVLIIAAIIVALLLGSRKRRTDELKQQFGPEYQHAVQQYGDQQEAEEQLQARQKRVESFHIHALAPDQRERFLQQWKQVQAEFVDAPDRAIGDADHLVQQVMQERGYPVGDFEQQAADVSVDHPDVVTHYRTAHEIALKQDTNSATTEDLRQAMVHYKALFADLLQPDGNGRAGGNGVRAEANQTREVNR